MSNFATPPRLSSRDSKARTALPTSHLLCTLIGLFTTIGVLTVDSSAPANAAAGVFDLPDGFIDEGVAENIDTPVGLAFLPDGRLLVIEQMSGEIAIIPVASGIATTVFTVPDIESGGEKGLLGITVDPDWPARPYIYVYFDHSSGNRIHIRMYTASGDLSDPASTDVSLTSPYDILTDIPDVWANHNGGTIRFGPDGMLYAGTGDDAQPCDAQDLTSLSGKILRLDVSSLPGAGAGPPPKSDITPADNPFPGPNENERLVYSHGLRNPFRFHIDPMTGLLYIGDVGEGVYEELDEAFGGDNFGWPKREGAHDYPPGSGCPGTNGTDPIAEYDRTGLPASIIGGPLYRVGGADSFPPEYDGVAFFHEYYQGFIRRLVFNPTTSEWEPAPVAAGQPNAEDWGTGYAGVSEMLQGPDGSFYYTHQWWDSVRRIRNDNPVTTVTTSHSRELGLLVQPNPVVLGEPTRFHYALPVNGRVEISIYDLRGALIERLVDEIQRAGDHSVTWDGPPEDRTLSTSGVFFVRLKTADSIQTRKLMLIQ